MRLKSRQVLTIISVVALVLLVGCGSQSREKDVINNLADNVQLTVTSIDYEFEEYTINALIENKSDYVVTSAVFWVKNKHTNDDMMFISNEGLNPGDTSANIKEFTFDKVTEDSIEVYKADITFMYQDKECWLEFDYNTDTYRISQ